ncbi:hypothetical protein EI94DRAFT_1702148 [Lactarius quietus]|nr:hypothetical protein EI94DRAFT_1792071 [Lactarius quietus]KAF8265853.1 hypothetical protein EI94DRAFT_1702148 [Lactarius quietus]
MELACVRRRSSEQVEGGICPEIESIELWCCIKPRNGPEQSRSERNGCTNSMKQGLDSGIMPVYSQHAAAHVPSPAGARPGSNRGDAVRRFLNHEVLTGQGGDAVSEISVGGSEDDIAEPGTASTMESTLDQKQKTPLWRGWVRIFSKLFTNDVGIRLRKIHGSVVLAPITPNGYEYGKFTDRAEL